MKKIFLQLVSLSLIVLYVLPAMFPAITVADIRTGVIAALLFAFINIAVKPILKIVTLPLNIITLGLFGVVLNVLLFWFVAGVIDGFTVPDFVTAVWGALTLSIANWILQKLFD